MMIPKQSTSEHENWFASIPPWAKATGVLTLCIGTATGLIYFLDQSSKISTAPVANNSSVNPTTNAPSTNTNLSPLEINTPNSNLPTPSNPQSPFPGPNSPDPSLNKNNSSNTPDQSNSNINPNTGINSLNNKETKQSSNFPLVASTNNSGNIITENISTTNIRIPEIDSISATHQVIPKLPPQNNGQKSNKEQYQTTVPILNNQSPSYTISQIDDMANRNRQKTYPKNQNIPMVVKGKKQSNSQQKNNNAQNTNTEKKNNQNTTGKNTDTFSTVNIKFTPLKEVADLANLPPGPSLSRRNNNSSSNINNTKSPQLFTSNSDITSQTPSPSSSKIANSEKVQNDSALAKNPTEILSENPYKIVINSSQENTPPNIIIPQVKEVQEYLQTRWKVPEGLNQTIQYILVLDYDGTITQIQPIEETAKKYFTTTNIPSAGEKFVSSFPLGKLPKIRVVFNQDGKVQTFLEDE